MNITMGKRANISDAVPSTGRFKLRGLFDFHPHRTAKASIFVIEVRVRTTLRHFYGTD